MHEKKKIYIFKNQNLENIALTHPSFEKNIEFQRFEFFGDKLLGFEIAKILMQMEMNDKNNSAEGHLTVSLSELVRKETVAQIGAFLVPFLKYTGNLNDAIISDCMEAWLAAVWSDGGNASRIIKFLWKEKIKNDFNTFNKSPKNLVQEFAQKKNSIVKYNYLQKNNQFLSFLKIQNIEVSAYGNSKKQAAENAAIVFIKKYIKHI